MTVDLKGTTQHYTGHMGIKTKEGRLLGNVRAAPICNHFTVVTGGCWIREVCLF